MRLPGTNYALGVMNGFGLQDGVDLAGNLSNMVCGWTGWTDVEMDPDYL